ncbi:MAG: protease, partial [Rhodothermales bacterium]|nr:protease [Rhodothermales bacterium]
AWFSDASGEYALRVTDQYGRDGRTIEIDNPTYFAALDWAPDSRHVAFRDVDQNLHVYDTEDGKGRIVDNAGYSVNSMTFDWSPDSRWLAYSKKGDNHYHRIYVYSLEEEESHPITDGMSEANNPVFDANGDFLYFLSSVDYGLNVGWLDMSSYNQPVNRSLHLVVLAADTPNPLAPRSDDEDVEDPAEDSAAAADSLVTIDFEGLQHRILAVEVPERPYTSLGAGTEGVIFIGENVPNEPGQTVHRYKIEERKAEKFLTGVSGFVLTDDGKKMGVSRSGNRYAIIDADGAPNQTDGALDLSEMQMYVDPAAEWRQMFEEGIRKQRDQLYVENVHGLDLDWFRSAYGPMVDHIRHRSDLTYLLDILGGETSIGHSFAGGGDEPDVESVSVGLLGADLEVDGGRYRIEKIYHGDPWDPDVTAPLSGPGIDVSDGDYILAVNGRELTAADNFHSAFERTNGRETILDIASTPNADADERRRVTVHPLASEVGLRQFNWVESNRHTVDEMSGGRLAYVWLPNTGTGGYNNFNRYYFAQKHKQGAVIDERYNGGGSAADYIVDYLARELMGYFNNTADPSSPYTTPNAALFGPKVMIINERAGSGGDLLPYMFKKREIGPLVGTTTWGGLVGWGAEPRLIDGGYVASPGFGFYDTDGEWAVENEGVAPDIEVEESPRLAAEGRDAQLEAAVREALRLLKTQAVELLPQPPDPVRVRRARQE